MTLEQRLRDYAANGCRSWQGIEAVFIEAADALAKKDAALKPFADAATEAETYSPESGHGRDSFLANCVYLSDLQAARDAL